MLRFWRSRTEAPTPMRGRPDAGAGDDRQTRRAEDQIALAARPLALPLRETGDVAFLTPAIISFVLQERRANHGTSERL